VRILASLGLGLLALAAFTSEGLLFATWAAERSAECRGGPSLSCAATVVVAPLVAVTAGASAAVGVGLATGLYLGGRKRKAAVVAATAVGLLGAAHVLLLV
jgi:hypothetical protein